MTTRRSNGEGSVRERTINGNKYWVADFCVTVNGITKRKTVSGKSRYEAVTKMKNIMAQEQTGQLVEKSKATISQIIETWLETKKHSVELNTYYSYKYSTEQHIVPELGTFEVQKVSMLQLQRFINKMIEDGISNRNVRYAGYILKTCLAFAVDQNILIKNPALKIKLPAPEKNEIKLLTDDQIEQFKAVNKDNPYFVPVILQASTGLRKGECIALTWDCVDFDNQTITINKQTVVNSFTGEVITKNKLKNKYSNRIIPIDDEVTQLLKVNQQKISQFPNPQNLCFPTSNGNIVHPRNYQRSFDRMLADAELPKVKIHSLRHKFINDTIEATGDLRSIAEYVGHADTRMATEVYSHSDLERKRRLLQKAKAIKNTAS